MDIMLYGFILSWQEILIHQIKLVSAQHPEAEECLLIMDQ